MENRFGIKDLFLFLLIGGLIVLVVLAMVQFDRQFRDIQSIKQQQDGLVNDLAKIRRQLAEGVATVGPAAGGGSSTQPVKDAFTRLREAEKKPDFARGDWFIDNFATKVGKLTPHVSSDIYQSWVERQVMDLLADRDPQTLEYLPRLATSWEQSPDGLKMTFHLRRGVEFSDGVPLTADDVLYTFELIRNPQINSDRTRSYLTELDQVKKVDDYTVEFTFKKFYYRNFDSVANLVGIMPKHFYGKFTADQYNEKTGLLMGSGPYKLKDPENWTPGQPVELYRNERFWGVPPTFDRIRFNELQGEATEMVVYGNQEHDIIRCTSDQYEKLTHDPRIMAFSNAYDFPDVFRGFMYVGWNQERAKDGKPTKTFFADKRVRQAMTILFDRERVVRELTFGHGRVATGPFMPGGPQSDPTVKPWPYDEAMGKSLLAQAGFTDRNGDGILEDAEGKPFRFTLTYPSGMEMYEKFVLMIKDNYARAGVVLVPDRVDWPVLVNRLNNSDFDSVVLGWSGEPESDPYQIFHSSQIAGQGDNRTHYINPELDKVIEQARSTVDEKQRMELWHKVHRILHEDQPFTFVLNRNSLWLVNKRVKNIERATIGLNFEYLAGGMIPWYVPKGMQKYTK
jgi:peptide/nickel transport system substrate-binding protein